jgi:FkbM family methyltransferase
MTQEKASIPIRATRFIGRLIAYAEILGIVNAMKICVMSKFAGRVLKIKIRQLDRTVCIRGKTSDRLAIGNLALGYPHVRIADIKTIIDAGANIGDSSLALAAMYPEARVLSLEPNEQTFEILTRNIQSHPRISAAKLALWSHCTTVKIKNPASSALDSSVSEEKDGRVQAYEIPALLNLQKWAAVDLLKLDIEGAEREVFRAKDLNWVHTLKVMIVETHDHLSPGATRQIFLAMSRYDFNCWVMGENLVFVRNTTSSIHPPEWWTVAKS